jgi:UDP-glucose 4-epimerase
MAHRSASDTAPASTGGVPETAPAARRLLITGADGFLGRSLVAALAGPGRTGTTGLEQVIALDVRDVPAERRLPGVDYRQADVRDPRLADAFAGIDTVVHLASIVTPGRGSTREMEYAVDVGGTRRVLDACLQHGVRHLVVSSSGAAYGYHADLPAWITEDTPLRGHPAFAYAEHKRLVEAMLAEARQSHPALLQTVLRIGTILGERVDNQITALFEKPRLLAVRGHASPFVFVWDEDVTGAIAHAIGGHGRPGCWNLAGDGALSVPQIAARLGKPVRALPAGLLTAALTVGHALRLTRYGPAQLDFLRYRPVLLNSALKKRFGYVPRWSSAEAFDRFVAARAAQGRPVTAA